MNIYSSVVPAVKPTQITLDISPKQLAEAMTNLTTSIHTLRQNTTLSYIRIYRQQAKQLKSLQWSLSNYIQLQTLRHEESSSSSTSTSPIVIHINGIDRIYQYHELPDLHQLSIWENHLNQIIQNVLTWSELQETTLISSLDSLYEPSTTEPIRTNNGTVIFRRHKQNGQMYALKTSTLGQPQHLDDPLRESWFYLLCSKDTHPNTFAFSSVLVFRHQLHLITPQAMGADLLRFITNHPDNSRQCALYIMYTMCLTIDYLHNHLGIAHLDIKPENIFLDRQQIPLLADFGMSRIDTLIENEHNQSQGFLWNDAHGMTTVLKNVVTTADVQQTTPNQLPRFFLRIALLPHVLEEIDERKSALGKHVQNNIMNNNNNTTTQVQSQQQYNPVMSSFDEIDDKLDITTAIDAFGWPNIDEESQAYGVYQYTFESWCATHHPEFSLSSLSSLSSHPSDDDDDDDSSSLISSPSSQTLDLATTTTTTTSPTTTTTTTKHLLRQFYAYAMNALQSHPDGFVYLRSGISAELYSVCSPDLSHLSRQMVTRPYGTRAYMAPEVLRKSPQYDPFKADIYSLGIVFFILCTSFAPYHQPVVATDVGYRYFSQIAMAAATSSAQQQVPQSQDSVIAQLLTAYGRAGSLRQDICELLSTMVDFDPHSRANIKTVLHNLHKIIARL